MEFGGYFGKRLRINLYKSTFFEEEINENIYRDYVGGRGLNVKLMYDEVIPEVEPFSGRNPLIFSAGPLVGTPAFFANRMTISAKSPLTGVIGDSNIGGPCSLKFKSTGYDQMIISGKSPEPVYLIISEGKVEFRSAKHLWGKSTGETMLLLKKEVNDADVEILCIGPAGENLVRYSVILTNEHAAGRTGMGAVMGSKKVKAIIFQGKTKTPVKNRELLKQAMRQLSSELSTDPSTEQAGRYGATTAIESFQSLGVLEVKNFQTGIMEGVEKISGKTVREKYTIKNRGCPTCPIRCRGTAQFHSKEFGSFLFGGPEFAALQNFGSRIGNTHLDAICFITKLSNEYGIDFMSLGGVLSWVMECYQKGLLTKSDLDGLDLNWGNYSSVILLLDKIAHRRGVGDILAEGSYRASKEFGNNTNDYQLTVKKMEFEMCDPRGYKGRGTGCGTSNRGADNCRTLSSIESSITEQEAKELFGHKDAASLRGVRGKGKLLKFIEDFTAISELLGLCRYGMYSFVSGLDKILLRSEIIAKSFSYITGMVDPDQAYSYLLGAGERLINLERLFNVREGLRRSDDLLPARFRFEPMPEGPSQGSIVENDEILDEYYAARGWDIETSIPHDETLKRLNL